EDKNRESLNSLLKPDDTLSKIRLKMLAVCTSAESRIDDILENLLVELANDEGEKIN
ncbi:MAG: hypothetical protein HOC24_00385, partial [Deltaproteobacteria bacterium]|nr:hypothetical protein [Deltaproteobacteria bacterium]